MADQKIKTARNIAVTVLNQFDSTGNYVGPILDKLLAQAEERQRATDIVFGCVRNRKAIDMVVTKLADCPIDRIPAKVLNIIRIGAYELIYSPATRRLFNRQRSGRKCQGRCGQKADRFC